jgi:hypothetical protein
MVGTKGKEGGKVRRGVSEKKERETTEIDEIR